MEPKYVLFDLFGRPVTLFSLCVILAIAAGLLLIRREQKKSGLRADTTEIFALLAIPLGLLGGRIVYCLANLGMYMELGLLQMLKLWEGGYSMLGILPGVALAGWITGKITRQPAAKVLDMIAAPAALMIALCRFAEWASGQGTTLTEVENPFFQRFPFAVYDADWEVWFWVVFTLEGVAAWIISLVLQSKKLPKVPGSRAKLLVILLCCSQMFLEMLRREGDALVLNPWFIRITQVGAMAALVILMIAALFRWKKAAAESRMSGWQMGLHWALTAILAGINVWMQFAVQKSADLPVWTCYTIMALTCVGIGFVSYFVIFHYKRSKE